MPAQLLAREAHIYIYICRRGIFALPAAVSLAAAALRRFRVRPLSSRRALLRDLHVVKLVQKFLGRRGGVAVAAHRHGPLPHHHHHLLPLLLLLLPQLL
ncbi:uncharacterized protein Tco025E_05876, partial [Trypanosoma conorhini]